MSPKSAISYKKRKRGHSEQTLEREIKARHDQPPLLLPKFENEGAEYRFITNISRRNVIPSKPLDETFDAQTNIPLFTSFKNVGWEGFVSYDDAQFPTLVKLFYTHFQCTGDVVTSSVRGTKIQFTSQDIYKIFGIQTQPNAQRIRYYEMSKWAEYPSFEPLTALNQIRNTPTSTLSKPSISDLTLEARLIHLVVAHNVLPRSGGTNIVTYLDVFVMWCILNRKPLCLGYLVIQHMNQLYNRGRNMLPFGNHLTRIFEYFKVPLSAENDRCETASGEPFSSFTLGHLGYREVDSGWVKKASYKGKKQITNDPPPQTKEEFSSEDEDSSPPSTPSPPSSPQPIDASGDSPTFGAPNSYQPSDLTNMLDHLQTLIQQSNALQANMNSGVEYLANRVKAVENQILEFGSDLGIIKNHQDSLKDLITKHEKDSKEAIDRLRVCLERGLENPLSRPRNTSLDPSDHIPASFRSSFLTTLLNGFQSLALHLDDRFDMLQNQAKTFHARIASDFLLVNTRIRAVEDQMAQLGGELGLIKINQHSIKHHLQNMRGP